MRVHKKMVGKQGFEPWTSTASGWRSPPELLAYIQLFALGEVAVKRSCVKQISYFVAFSGADEFRILTPRTM